MTAHNPQFTAPHSAYFTNPPLFRLSRQSSLSSVSSEMVNKKSNKKKGKRGKNRQNNNNNNITRVPRTVSFECASQELRELCAFFALFSPHIACYSHKE